MSKKAMEKVMECFRCVTCNGDLKNPVELACRHIVCKGCLTGLAKCTLCSARNNTIRSGWNTRSDITSIHKIWLQFVSTLEKERNVISVSNDTSEKSPVQTNGTSARPEPVVHDVPDKPPSTVSVECQPNLMNQVVGTEYETQLEDSEVYGHPNTPLEPYPFDTQLMPSRPKETSPPHRRTSMTDKIPLIDTQVFAPWDTQAELSPTKSITDDGEPERLTQSQPLDLTLAGQEVQAVMDVPYAARRPAFSPAKPLDLRVALIEKVSTKTNGSSSSGNIGLPANKQEQLSTASGQLTTPEDRREPERILPQEAEPVASATPVQQNSKPVPTIRTTPRTRRALPEQPLPCTPTPQPSKPKETPCRSTPTQKRQRQLQLRNEPIMTSTPEVVRRADPDTQFGDGDDDQMLLEVEDCLNLVNFHKRPRDDNQPESSDDELFPSSLPNSKRQKTNGELNSSSSSASATKKRENQKENFDMPKENSFRLATPTPPTKNNVTNVTIENPLENPEPTEESEEDQFGPNTWHPLPEELLELERPPPPVQKFVFCPTRLYSDQIAKLEKLCKLCNGEIRKDFSEEVTHLILNLDKDGISYTFKYLMSIARKKWVLSFAWVEECVKEGRIVPEESFETSNFPGSDPGVRISRLSSKNVFDGFKFYVPFDIKSSGVSASDCKQLLIALGAEIVKELPKTNERLLIVGDLTNYTINYQQLYEDHGWLTISWDWILDCVLGYKLFPFSAEHILTPGVDGIVLSQVSVPRPLLTL